MPATSPVSGTMSVALNKPFAFVDTMTGVVGWATPSSVRATTESDPKPVPLRETVPPVVAELAPDEMVERTVNAVLPSPALTTVGPPAIIGTVKVAVNVPLESVVIVLGKVVATTLPSLTVTCVSGARLTPLILTVAPTGAPMGETEILEQIDTGKWPCRVP